MGTILKQKLEPFTCARLTAGNHTLFVRTEWRGNSFVIEATDGTEAWVCEVDPELIEVKANDNQMSSEEFISRAYGYLQQQKDGAEYQFEGKKGGQRKLSWLTDVSGTNVRIKWTMTLCQEPGPIIVRILEMLVDDNGRHQEAFERKTRALEKAQKEALQAQEQSRRFEGEKKRLQDELFKKFVAVLNTKKAKLRELRKTMEAMEQRSDARSVDSGDDDYHSPKRNRSEGDDEEDSGDNNSHDGERERVNRVKEEDSVGDGGKDGTNGAGPSVTKGENDRLPGVPTAEEEQLDIKPRIEVLKGVLGTLDGDKDKLLPKIGGEAIALLETSGYTSAPKKRRR